MYEPDFRPSLMGVRFYRGQRDPELYPHDTNISQIKLDTNDVFELGVEIKLGGLQFLKHSDSYVDSINKYSKQPLTEEEIYQPFYINLALEHKIGQKEVVLLQCASNFVDIDMLKDGEATFLMTITKFRNDIEDYNPAPNDNYIESFLVFSVFTSPEKIETVEDYYKYGNNFYYNLMQTKLPYVAEVNK